MWKITRDFISDKGEKKETGKHTQDFDKDKAVHEFRLLDDDGIVYYHGLCDTNDNDNAFEPLDYYGAYAGCTEIQYKVNGKWETL